MIYYHFFRYHDLPILILHKGQEDSATLQHGSVGRQDPAEVRPAHRIVSNILLSSLVGEGETVSNTRLGEICQALLRIIPEQPSSLLKLTMETNKEL